MLLDLDTNDLYTLKKIYLTVLGEGKTFGGKSII